MDGFSKCSIMSGLIVVSPAPTAFFSVVDPLHISDAERLFGTAPQAFMSTSFVWVNIIAIRCSHIG